MFSKKEDTKCCDKFEEGMEKLTKGLGSILSDMKSELSAVKEIAYQKDTQIKKYEDGYDYQILKNFINEIFKILDNIDKNNENPQAVLEETKEDLLIMLENANIQKIDIKVGDTYSGNEKIAKVVSTQQTEDEDKLDTIASVSKNGYEYIIDDNQSKVLRVSEVSVYKRGE